MILTNLILFFFIPLLSTNHVTDKSSQAEPWTKEELRAANTAGDAKYLTGEEKDMVIYMNLARMDGEKFFNTYFQDYM
ncbi:MAG TPA: CAP domain-containing protein, partial [Pedobacter sp.]